MDMLHIFWCIVVFFFRPMRDLLNCITNVVEECPTAAQYMEEMLQNMYKELKKHGGLDVLSYDDSKKYIMTYCPLLPSGL